MKNSRSIVKVIVRPALYTATLVLLAASLSCGHFQGPQYSGTGPYSGADEYVSQGEFEEPQEMYKSDDVLKAPPPSTPRGPFRLQWPVRKMLLSRGFTESGSKAHLGLDIRGRRGSAILAAHDGIVIYAGSSFRGYGKMIIIEYDETWATLYGHLHSFRVKTGQEVKAGTVIGTMGRTGRATGVHLHFELMRDKIPLDPTPLLPAPPTT